MFSMVAAAAAAGVVCNLNIWITLDSFFSLFSDVIRCDQRLQSAAAAAAVTMCAVERFVRQLPMSITFTLEPSSQRTLTQKLSWSWSQGRAGTWKSIAMFTLLCFALLFLLSSVTSLLAIWCVSTVLFAGVPTSRLLLNLMSTAVCFI